VPLKLLVVSRLLAHGVERGAGEPRVERTRGQIGIVQQGFLEFLRNAQVRLVDVRGWKSGVLMQFLDDGFAFRRLQSCARIQRACIFT
jgi:hypothetical protein